MDISQSKFDVIFSVGCYAVRQTFDPGTYNLSLVFVKLLDVKGVQKKIQPSLYYKIFGDTKDLNNLADI